MKLRAALVFALLLTACTDGAADEDAQRAVACSQAGSHAAVFSRECLEGIKAQIARKPSTFFVLRFDQKRNLYLQGALAPENVVVLEVPGPRFAQIGDSVAQDIRARGFTLDPKVGNYVLPLSTAALEDGRFEKYLLWLGKRLGYPEGANIRYEVGELAFPGGK